VETDRITTDCITSLVGWIGKYQKQASDWSHCSGAVCYETEILVYEKYGWENAWLLLLLLMCCEQLTIAALSPSRLCCDMTCRQLVITFDSPVFTTVSDLAFTHLTDVVILYIVPYLVGRHFLSNFGFSHYTETETGSICSFVC